LFDIVRGHPNPQIALKSPHSIDGKIRLAHVDTVAPGKPCKVWTVVGKYRNSKRLGHGHDVRQQREIVASTQGLCSYLQYRGSCLE
jgi:hypothetical protein